VGGRRPGEEPMIRGVYPYLCIRGAGAALEFYREVFGAELGLRWDADDGTVTHAEFRMGEVTFMVSDEYPELGIHGPEHWGGTPVRFHLHVDDVDGVARRAEAAGAVILRGPRDEAHGERQCLLRDPWGHAWLLGDGED
jgi:PhnB protein